MNESIPRDISVDEFAEHVREMHRDTDRGFAYEYDDIKNMPNTSTTNIAQQPHNKLKNRFTNIFPCKL